MDKFDRQYHVLDTLTANVAAVSRAARTALATRPAPGPGQPPPQPAGEGAWSHSDLISEYLSALGELYTLSATYVTAQQVELLWDELVQGAPTRADLARAVPFFRSAVGREPWLEMGEVGALLRRVPALPAASVTKEVFQLAWEMFRTVRRRAAGQTGGPGAQGLHPGPNRGLSG